jgi:DNA-binding HxlR family transcriptional regulator
VRTYGQYCPIARAAEILATRWTPLILRNLLLGGTTFTEIADGAPGIPRSLLTTRLRELEQAGVITRSMRADGHGPTYHLTRSGEDLRAVMFALGVWGERWIELAPEHLDPGVTLSSWVRWYLAEEHLPPTRVCARFDFPDRTRKSNQLWILFDGPRSEVCRTFPGFNEDLVVTLESRALAEWHLGRISWGDGLRTGRITVSGPPGLAAALPTWNRRSGWARVEGLPGRPGGALP